MFRQTIFPSHSPAAYVGECGISLAVWGRNKTQMQSRSFGKNKPWELDARNSFRSTVSVIQGPESETQSGNHQYYLLFFNFFLFSLALEFNPGSR